MRRGAHDRSRTREALGHGLLGLSPVPGANTRTRLLPRLNHAGIAAPADHVIGARCAVGTDRVETVLLAGAAGLSPVRG